MSRGAISGIRALVGEPEPYRPDTTADDPTSEVKLLMKVPELRVHLARKTDRSVYAYIPSPTDPRRPQMSVDLGRKRCTDLNVAKAIVLKKLGWKCEQIIFEVDK